MWIVKSVIVAASWSTRTFLSFAWNYSSIMYYNKKIVQISQFQTTICNSQVIYKYVLLLSALKRMDCFVWDEGIKCTRASSSRMLAEVEVLYAHRPKMCCFIPGSLHISSPVQIHMYLLTSFIEVGGRREREHCVHFHHTVDNITGFKKYTNITFLELEHKFTDCWIWTRSL